MRNKKLMVGSVVIVVLAIVAAFFFRRNPQQSEAKENNEITVKLGVVGSVYERLWAPAIDSLKDEGINLELVQFSDFVTPNDALNNQEIDLNAFQFQSYLDHQVKDHGYHIESIGYTYTSRMNLYSKKVQNLLDIKDKDIVAIPDDVVNAGRALKVLENAGLLTLKKDASANPSVEDIENYKVNIELKLFKSNSIAPVISDVTAAIIPINYALDFGLTADDVVYKDEAVEDSSYWIVIATQSDNLKDAKKKAAYQKVVQAFQSEKTQAVFDDDFGGNYVKVGWDEDLFKK